MGDDKQGAQVRLKGETFLCWTGAWDVLDKDLEFQAQDQRPTNNLKSKTAFETGYARPSPAGGKYEYSRVGEQFAIPKLSLSPNQTNYCKDVSDEALYEIARRSQQKFESDQMERVARYAAEHGVDVPGTGGVRGGEVGRQPVEGALGGVGRDGGGGDTEEGAIDVDREARVPGEKGVPGHEDVPEVYPGTGERMEDFLRRAANGPVGEGSSKRKEGGTDPVAAPGGKRLRQQKVTDVYGGECVARHKKTFLRWLYSSGVPFNAFRNQAWKAYQQVLLEQPGSSPRAVFPSHSEIASMQAVETHREELAEELEEVRQPFWITGATLLSDGRKSQDGRPIVNFLAAGSRGVVVYTTINRKGEPDDAVHVLRRWVTIFHEFSFGGPQRVNAICTDSASAYVGAGRALASHWTPHRRTWGLGRRITWLPCSVHVCNKLLSDMGTSCDAFVDAITRARVLVVFFKTHQAALYFFRKRNPNKGFVLSCETRFAPVYSMLERLLALQDALQAMMRGDDGREFASIPWSADVCNMARWVRRQIRWEPWWHTMATIVHIMQPVMELLRRMDRGGQYMSLMIEWTQDLVRRVTDACAPLGRVFADCIIRRVQARTQHMLEPAHCVGFLLNPRRRHVEYFSGEVRDYPRWLVRQAKRYILTQTGYEEDGVEYIIACRQFEDFHMQQGTFGDWGGEEGRARGRACSGDRETIECASWWSQYGSGAPELQRCALRVMHMWSCASPAERNWAVHEGIHTKKRNQLAFEKVVQLVEITANVRLSEYRRAGCGYVLPWQRDEGMLDCQGGLELEPVRTGTRRGMTPEEIARQVALITKDPIEVSAPPAAEAVFGRRASIFRPYPREDDSDEEPVPEAADDPALRIPREIDETHLNPEEDTRAHTARRDADRAEREMMGGEEELWGPFGEVASTGNTGARATSPAPTRQESSMPPPSAPSPAPPSPVAPYEPTTVAKDTEELASSLPQRGLLHRGGAVRQLRLRSPSLGVLQKEGGPSAAAVEGEMTVEGGLEGTTIAGVVDQITVAAATSLLEEMAASVLAEEAPAPRGADAVEGQAGVAGGAAGGAAGGEAGGAAGGAAALDGLVAAAAGAAGGADAVEGGMPGAVEEEIGAQAEVSRGGGDERLMQQFLTEQYDPVMAGMTPGRRRDEGVGDARCVVRETTTGLVVPFSGLHLAQGRQSQPVSVAVHGVPLPIITDLGSEPVVAPPRLPSHFAPQEVRRPLDADELAREAVRDVTRLDRRVFDQRLQHPPWQAIPPVPWGPASPVWSGSTSTGARTTGDVPGVSGGVVETAPRTRDMPPPPPRPPVADPSSSPTGKGSRSPHTPGRSRIRDTTAVVGDVSDTALFRRTDIDLDSTRRVTEHTARLQPGLGPRGCRMTAAREVAASGCEPQRGRGRGVSVDSLEYALMTATRAVHEQTPHKRGVPPRPRPVPAEGGDALGETSGAEGLGMPRGSHRKQTVTEASARVVVLRKAGAPVTIEEDDPDTDVAVREEDEDYEGEEEGEEESERGSDGDYDHDEHKPPPAPPKEAELRAQEEKLRQQAQAVESLKAELKKKEEAAQKEARRKLLIADVEKEKKKHKLELILLRPSILGAKIKGLLDCGATRNFISPKAVSKLHLDQRDYLHSRLDMTSGRHPEANGQPEVMNQILFQLLRAVISPDQQDWDLHLSRAQLVYNTFVHSSTGFTPYRLHWGREPRQALDDIIDKATPTLTPGTAEFTRRYRVDVERARANLLKTQKAMIQQANKHRRPSTIRTGDWVWVLSCELSREEDISPKLLPRYMGPWQVLNTVGADPFGPSYTVDVPLHLQTCPVFHASKLLPFTPADAFPDRPPQFGPPIPGKGYEVETVEDESGSKATPWTRSSQDSRKPSWALFGALMIRALLLQMGLIRLLESGTLRLKQSATSAVQISCATSAVPRHSAKSQYHVSSATSQYHVSSATSQCQISSATSAVPDQQCHVRSARSHCHVRHSATATSAVTRKQHCHVSNMTGLPGQLANETIAAYKQRCLAQIEAEEQRLLAVEAARIQAEEAAAAEKLRLQADAEADAQARRKEAQDLLQRHEANSIDRLKYWHFQPNGDDATPEEKHKEFPSKLVTRLLYACNYQRSELERQHRDLTQQHQELATLRRTVQSHEDATRALNARLLDLEQAVPGPAAGASSSAPSSCQLEDRVDHVVAMLGDISTFAAPTTTISSQLHSWKTEVQKLQSTNADDNPKMYKMPTFNLERFDDYTQQNPVLWWEAFTTQLRILPVAKHAYIGALFLNSKGGCQTWLSHLATSHGVDVPDLKDVITWEELTRLWKKRFIVDDAPTLAINRLFTMSQGNIATRDWLTEWQKIAAVPNLNLPFQHLRCEFYNRENAPRPHPLGKELARDVLLKAELRGGDPNQIAGAERARKAIAVGLTAHPYLCLQHLIPCLDKKLLHATKERKMVVALSCARQRTGKRVLWRQKRQDHTLVVFDDETVERWSLEAEGVANNSDSGKGEVTAVVVNKGRPRPPVKKKKPRSFPEHPGIAVGKPWEKKEGNEFPHRPSMIPPDMDGRYEVDRIMEHGYFSTGGRGRPQKQFKMELERHAPCAFSPLIVKMSEKTKLKSVMMWKAWRTVTAISYSVLAGPRISAESLATSVADLLRSGILNEDSDLESRAFVVDLDRYYRDYGFGEDMNDWYKEEDVMRPDLPLGHEGSGTEGEYKLDDSLAKAQEDPSGDTSEAVDASDQTTT
ncbi:hypothetical protein CBR_g41582 [Chara braunii]|uniref:Uncharacterized protein n=1 Tax=Chara braunii TaxID=69332 RepID=A0A388K2U6_CHABU|nr:hypothetical protein CBR_g41582 [Chara braunii]|eukprot:GBG64381.1 hypothetical protein CBR_g41582 [Chara braunii]